MVNPSELNNLRKKYELTASQKQRIAQLIINDFTTGIKSVEFPTAVILGGQPGAGKGELITVASSMLKENVVICNADDFRDYHPRADEIKRFHEDEYPEITVEYSQPWNNLLKEHCIQNRYNFILETTFSSGNSMNVTIAELKNAGYTVFLMVLSVNSKLSYLGTRIRYEEMRATTSYGRLVEKKVHDKKYDLVPTTLGVVHAERLYDKIFIYGRADGQNTRGKRRGLVLLSENGKDPVEDYMKERDKEWTDSISRYFNNDVLYLLRRMIDREAPHSDMADIFKVFEVGAGSEPAE